jgi:nucleoside-diphosphate-sugar epimerase
MPDEDRYLITGAGGFIGGWLSEALFLENKIQVRAGIHNWMGAARLARFNMDIVPCDIANPEQIDVAVSGVSHIIHCAKGSSAESIISGTRNILEAALIHKVKRFVYISTAEVYGNQDGTFDETYSCTKTGNIYGDAKLEAEWVCQDYSSKGLPVTIIRPSIVYGPLSKTWTVNIGFKLQSGSWRKFKDSGEGICNLIYISDLVDGIIKALRSDTAVNEKFNLVGPDLLTWNQYFEKFNQVMDLPALQEINPTQLRLGSALMEPIRSSAKYARDHFEKIIKEVGSNFSVAKQLMKYLEKKIKTTPRVEDLDLYNRKALYPAQRAQIVFGFSPVYHLETGLNLTVAWMKQVGLIND